MWYTNVLLTLAWLDLTYHKETEMSASLNHSVSSPLIASYANGGYGVSVYADGTKVRETLDSSVPPVRPEQMDLKITDWCDAGCAWCHEKSTVKGAHGDMRKTLQLLSVLPAGSEIAIGGGDPLSHPDFEYLVEGLSEQGLVPSVTVNGLHFARHRAVLEKLTGQGKLYGVGYSYADSLPDWDYENLVLHLIAGVHAPAVLDDAARRFKVLLLGYKTFGRGKKMFDVRPAPIQEKLAAWYRELFWVAQEHHLSFDNLAIDQLKPNRLFKDSSDYTQQWMGPEGEFSMYVDAVTETYALSSYSPARLPWSDLESMFGTIRTTEGFAKA